LNRAWVTKCSNCHRTHDPVVGVIACSQHLRPWRIIVRRREAHFLTQLHPARLLTTSVRIAVALGLTAFVLVLAIRGGLHFGHTESGSLLPWDFLLHGRSLIAANVAWHVYLCWLGFWFIRGTAGTERAFMIGWFANILLGPIESLRPQWGEAIRYIGIFGFWGCVSRSPGTFYWPRRAYLVPAAEPMPHRCSC
jgi:hypothetical protein